MIVDWRNVNRLVSCPPCRGGAAAMSLNPVCVRKEHYPTVVWSWIDLDSWFGNRVSCAARYGPNYYNFDEFKKPLKEKATPEVPPMLGQSSQSTMEELLDSSPFGFYAHPEEVKR